MRIKSLWLPVFLLILSACTKKETELLSLKTDIEGKVFTISETGELSHDYANVTLAVEGTDPQQTYSTDTSGLYSIAGLPLGNYNFRFSREGYGEVIKNIKVVGSDEPKKLTTYLYQKSKTVINGYSLEVNNSILTIKGTLQHQYPKDRMTYYGSFWPAVSVYLSNKPDVSDRNYLVVRSIKTLSTNSNNFEFTYTLYNSVFPSGSTVYAIIYGKNLSAYISIYDFETDNYYDSSLGVPSEIKSIMVP